MEWYLILIITLCLMMAVVIYQSRNENITVRILLSKLFVLNKNLFEYIKDVFMYIIERFGQIEWNSSIKVE